MRHYPPAGRALFLSLLATGAMLALPFGGYWCAAPVLMMAALVFGIRATVFEAALPINARSFLFARIIWSLVLVAVPFLVASAVMQLDVWRHAFRYDISGEFASKPWSPVQVVCLATALCITVAIPFAIRTEELNKPPVPRVLAGWGVLIAAFVAARNWLPSLVALEIFAVILVSVLLRIAVVSRIGFLVSSSSVTSDSPATSGSGQNGSVSRVRLLRPIIASLFPVQLVYFYVCIVLFAAARLEMWSLFLPILITAGSELVHRRVNWLRALPLSNSSRLFALLLPTAFVGLLCVVLGSAMPDPKSLFEDSSLTRFRQSMHYGAPDTYGGGQEPFYHSPTEMPLQYWSRVTPTTSLRLESPWGETVQAYTLSVPGLTLYNPYSTAESNSERFIDWQFARATKVMYGVELPRTQYEKHEGVLPRRTEDSPPMLYLNLVIVAIYILYAVLVTEFSRWHRFKGNVVLQSIFGLLAVVPPCGILLLNIKFGTLFTRDVVSALSQAALMALIHRAHDYLPLLFIVSLVPLLVLYQIISWVFARTEYVAPRVKAVI